MTLPGKVTQISLLHLMQGVSNALDMMSQTVQGHHRRVARWTNYLGRYLGIDEEDLRNVVLAALVHDIGAFSVRSRVDSLRFELPYAEHSEVGYRLLRTNSLLGATAGIIRHHHTPFAHFHRIDESDKTLALANLLNAADRMDVLLLGTAREGRVSEVPRLLRKGAGSTFEPRYVEALLELYTTDFQGDNGDSDGREWTSCMESIGLDRLYLDLDEFWAFALEFTQVIDFKSRFTATHSRSVAACAAMLAELDGFSMHSVGMMRAAGCLHDLGKLGVASEILEKPGALDDDEFALIRSHVTYTDAILNCLEGPEDVRRWAAEHHERPKGGGYPLGTSGAELSRGGRIMAVADIFTALTEDRPYRPGMTKSEVKTVLLDKACQGHVDPDVVDVLISSHDALLEIRRMTQKQAEKEFRAFLGS